MIDGDPDDHQEEWQRFQRKTLGPGDDGPKYPRQDTGEDKMETKGTNPNLPAVRRLQGSGWRVGSQSHRKFILSAYTEE
jgi:hypothetical protein